MKKQKEKGITLIALVVTIIVLLILAAISIAMLTDNNSLINQAKNAKVITGKAQIEEAVKLAYAGVSIDKYTNDNEVTMEKIAEELEKEKYTVVSKDVAGGTITGINLSGNIEAFVGETTEIQADVQTASEDSKKYYVQANELYYEIGLTANGAEVIGDGIKDLNTVGGGSGSTNTITATSDDTTKATVTVENNTIKIAGVEEGDTTIRISVNGTEYKTETITVKTLGTLSSIEATTLTLDGACLLRATATGNVSWSSNDEDIVKVKTEVDGKTARLICGTETGTTKVKCKGADKTLECTVTSTAKRVWKNETTTNKPINGNKAWNNPTIPVGMIAIDTNVNVDGYTGDKATTWSTTATTQETGVKNGLVIMDENGNQFVWVPVKEVTSGTYPMAATLSGTDTNDKQKYRGVLYDITKSDTTYTKTAYSSTSDYREPAFLENTTYGDAVADDETKGYGLLKSILDFGKNGETNEQIKTAWTNQMQNEFDEMVEKVGNAGGFYFARYEMSKSGETAESIANAVARTAGSSHEGSTASSNANTWYGLYKEVQTYTNSNVTSTMIWGSQYDQMMIWMTDSGLGENLTSSTVPNGGTKNASSTITGTLTSTDKINNIYDLYGGRYEWTMEASSTDRRVARGGFYYGSYSPKFRYYYGNNYPCSASTAYCSRPTLYVE